MDHKRIKRKRRPARQGQCLTASRPGRSERLLTQCSGWTDYVLSTLMRAALVGSVIASVIAGKVPGLETVLRIVAAHPPH